MDTAAASASKMGTPRAVGRPAIEATSLAQDDRELTWDRRDVKALAVVLAVGALFRGAYTAALGTPPYDPWRHLLLVDHLRSGLGFSLFEGQPYVWYNPGWHHLLAFLPPAIGPAWIAAGLSWLALVPLYVWVRGLDDHGPRARTAALLAGLLAAASGPVVRFTCHYGPEAFAWLLLLTGLALGATRSRHRSALASTEGLLFGVALTARMNFCFAFPLFLPRLARRARGRPARALGWAAGALLPLLLVWWRNRSAIRSYRFLFTWDGLATRTEDFSLLSTLVVQWHPAVHEGLRRLHERVVPVPQWIEDGGAVRWDRVLLIVLGMAAVVVSRRWALSLAALGGLGYFLLLDGTGSSHFFRIYLVLFPAMIAGLALVAADWLTRQGRAGTAGGVALLLITVAAGSGLLVPPEAPRLDQVTPPSSLLVRDRYWVNSGYYHPESLMWAFPDKRFAGLPIDPEQVPALLADYPEYRSVLWHQFSIQDSVLLRLEDIGFRPLAESRSSDGYRYLVLERPGGSAAPTDPGRDAR
jgi:hypothetical protein